MNINYGPSFKLVFDEREIFFIEYSIGSKPNREEIKKKILLLVDSRPLEAQLEKLFSNVKIHRSFGSLPIMTELILVQSSN